MAQVRGFAHEVDPFIARRHESQAMGEMVEEEEPSGASDESDDSLEPRYQISATVIEEMRKLERMFQEKGMRYRLIDRIGEGTYALSQLQRNSKLMFFRNILHGIQSGGFDVRTLQE